MVPPDDALPSAASYMSLGLATHRVQNISCLLSSSLLLPRLRRASSHAPSQGALIGRPRVLGPQESYHGPLVWCSSEPSDGAPVAYDWVLVGQPSNWAPLGLAGGREQIILHGGTTFYGENSIEIVFGAGGGGGAEGTLYSNMLQNWLA